MTYYQNCCYLNLPISVCCQTYQQLTSSGVVSLALLLGQSISEPNEQLLEWLWDVHQ
jgi:hypothetical protein